MNNTPVLPVFPLDSVVFPGHLLPLKIFEPRYLQLLKDCEASGEQRFIIGLISSGQEVGGPSTPFRVATLVRYTKIIQSDGLSFISPIGQKRVHLNRFIRDQKPYLMAEYSDFSDELETTDSPETHSKADLSWLEKKLSQLWISNATVESKEAYARLLLKKETLTAENYNLYLCGCLDMPAIHHQHLLESKPCDYRLKNLVNILRQQVKIEGPDIP